MKPLLCSLLLLSGAAALPAADDHTVRVPPEDPEMNAAIDAARRTLPVFWKAHAKPAPDESEFYLKLAITDGKETEHFWMSDVRKEEGRIVGLVANDPESVTTVKFGQKIVIDEAKISDWKFIKKGRTRGGYTIVVILKRLPKAEADEIKKDLGWN